MGISTDFIDGDQGMRIERVSQTYERNVRTTYSWPNVASWRSKLYRSSRRIVLRRRHLSSWICHIPMKTCCLHFSLDVVRVVQSFERHSSSSPWTICGIPCELEHGSYESFDHPPRLRKSPVACYWSGAWLTSAAGRPEEGFIA